MKKLLVSLLLALGVLTLLNGCSSSVERIGVEVHLIKLERKADGSLLASLQFSNPNIGSINLAKSTHQLTLNGKPAGMLDVTEALGLPAQQAITTTVSLRIANGSSELSGAVSYQLASTLTLSIYDDNTERYKTASSGTVKVE